MSLGTLALIGMCTGFGVLGTGSSTLSLHACSPASAVT